MNKTSAKLRAAFIDLDGTLLGPDKTISPANLEALRRLRARGIETVIASGRNHVNIAALAEQSGCSSWIVSSQGAMVKHALTGQVLAELTLPSALAAEVHAWTQTRALSEIIYTRDGVFMENETEWTRRYAAHYGRLQRAPVASLALSGLQKFLLSAAAADIPGLEAELRQAFGTRAHIVRSEQESVEILPAGVHKARGAQAVTDLLGVRPEETVAFGDGNNDIELFQWAGASVAMDHGWPEAKKAAGHITPAGPPEEAFARAVALLA
jgi:Cof subfamily protein (haloacid dehalogenase superfamily)